MTLTLSPLTKNQWKGVAKVTAWTVVSLACAIALALIEKNNVYLATTPLFNIFGKFIQGLLVTEEAVAISHLPSEVASVVEEAQSSLDPTPPAQG